LAERQGHNALENEDIFTVAELVDVEKEFLEAVGSFGEITIQEIWDLLNSLGLPHKWSRPTIARVGKKPK
jgi:DNA-directed RNA polymerase alpha subunit